jgi:hypothetical protein
VAPWHASSGTARGAQDPTRLQPQGQPACCARRRQIPRLRQRREQRRLVPAFPWCLLAKGRMERRGGGDRKDPHANGGMGRRREGDMGFGDDAPSPPTLLLCPREEEAWPPVQDPRDGRRILGGGIPSSDGGRAGSARWRAGPNRQPLSRGSLLHPQEKGPEGKSRGVNSVGGSSWGFVGLRFFL